MRAVEPTKLLILDAGDLAILTERNPELGRRIEQVVADRVEFQAQSGGDILPSEITEAHPAGGEGEKV